MQILGVMKPKLWTIDYGLSNYFVPVFNLKYGEK